MDVFCLLELGRESEQYQSNYSPRYSLHSFRHFSQFFTANNVLINPKERRAAPLMIVEVWLRSDLEIPSLSKAVPITKKASTKKGPSVCLIDVCIQREGVKDFNFHRAVSLTKPSHLSSTLATLARCKVFSFLNRSSSEDLPSRLRSF
jgi:hypothetical protein